ncbi:beta-L-arabinofuranosidase domain-containing protein [Streptococcus plurextorum]|uniref:beta-L-arabinofuranosidase domain-containing protein n=1 Tax=Streptococcus plurextorum TaxID=456876 RepID=UPI0004081623
MKHIEAHFGYENGKIQGADGHQEIELALVKLYDYTGDNAYLRLSQFFINVRGEDPEFYQKEIESNLKLGLSTDSSRVDLTYLQAFTQPKYQTKAVGHAVRLLYMATGMAKIVNRDFDNELYQPNIFE